MTIDTSRHTSTLIAILKDIYTNPKLAPYLGFKGGTAAMLFYGLARYSVDLDFDLFGNEEEIYEELLNLLATYGTVKRMHNKRYSVFFFLSYSNKMDKAYNIKIDVNKRKYDAQYDLKQYLGIPMRVVSPADMSSNKLMAMYERLGRANRDIFDIWYFFSNNWPINKQNIEQQSKMTYKIFLQKCIDALEAYSDHGILQGLGELLDEKQKRWAKTSMRKDTIFLLKVAESLEP